MDYTLAPRTPEELVEIWDAGVANGSYYKADTLDELAGQLGLDAAKLKAAPYRALRKGIGKELTHMKSLSWYGR